MTDFPQATCDLISEDSRVRVTRWTFTNGQATGMHTHQYDYVAIPITGGAFHVFMGDGTELDMTQIAGEPYSRQAGVHHNVQCVDDNGAVFVEVEFLTSTT